MPTRIPIYRDDIYKRLDDDKAEIMKKLEEILSQIKKENKPKRNISFKK